MKSLTNQEQLEKHVDKTPSVKIVVILLMAALVAVFVVKAFVASEKRRTEVKRIICKTNLFSIAHDLRLYIDDHSGKWPIADKWCDLLLKRDGVYRAEFQCPGPMTGECDYALNKDAIGLQFGEENKYIVFIFESKPGWDQVGGRKLLATDNHKDFGLGCNVLFGDGHAEWVPAEELTTLRWEP